MRNIDVLTDEEMRDAEINHDLVESYLYNSTYSRSEYYDIAVMGYLKGIQDYHRKPGVKDKYALSTICIRNIRNAILTYERDENRQKRKPVGGIVSLDVCIGDSDTSLENYIASSSLEDDYLNKYDIQEKIKKLKSMLPQLTAQQRSIIEFKVMGESLDFISKKLGISIIRINRELNKIYVQITESR